MLNKIPIDLIIEWAHVPAEEKLLLKRAYKNNIPTIPTTLGQELQINPFLRVSEISLREAISDKLDSSNHVSNAEVFGFLRSWKDSL